MLSYTGLGDLSVVVVKEHMTDWTRIRHLRGVECLVTLGKSDLLLLY